MASIHSVPILQSPGDPEVIDFGIGNPAPDLLPMERLRRATNMYFAEGNCDTLQYGYEAGNGYLRRELAIMLTRRTGVDTNSDHLLITNGASQGLDLVCTLFSKPGDTVFVEEPTYFLAMRIFADHGLRLIGIPIDANGINLTALESGLKRHKPAFLYTIPAFQNPSGVTLTQERRSGLVELSREYGFMIVADEVYQFLDFYIPPPAPLVSLADKGAVISLGSFSKILAPGLRLGWIHTSAHQVNQIAGCGLLDSGGGLNPFTSAIVRWLIATGELDAHIEELRTSYGRRALTLENALQKDLPELKFHRSQGGFFFWVQLPNGFDAEHFIPHAIRCGVNIRPGRRFSACNGFHDFMRLCFAYYDEDHIQEGVLRLKRALRSYLAAV